MRAVCLSVDWVPKLIHKSCQTMEQKFVQRCETKVVADACPVQTSQTFWTKSSTECPVQSTGIEVHLKVPWTLRTMHSSGVRDKVVCVQIWPVQTSQTSWTMWPRECPVESNGIQAQHKVLVNVETIQGGGVRDKVVCVQICPVQTSQTPWTMCPRKCPAESNGLRPIHRCRRLWEQYKEVWETRWSVCSYVLYRPPRHPGQCGPGNGLSCQLELRPSTR